MVNLQNRWILKNQKLYYYGMRNQPNLLKNTLKLSGKESEIIDQLPKTLSNEEKRILKTFIQEGIVVPKEKLKVTPKSIEEAVFCRQCAANDFMIAGLEFNEDGICPMCQSDEEIKNFKSVLPVVNEFPRSPKSRFDVAVFYTGGKDSSYLLHYLANIKKNRVLALTWDMPFMSTNALKSIENAKKCLPNVEFVNRKINDDDLKKMFKVLMERADNPCACPTPAYMLFFPLLVAENVPYFVAGNEPVQMLNLYFNRFAPRAAFSEKNHKILTVLTNIKRLLTLKPPLKKGQIEALMTMKQLAYGDPWFKKLSSYKHEILDHILVALEEIKTLKKPLRRSIKVASRTGRVPAFVQVDFNDISEGIYDWTKVQNVLKEKLNWVGPSSKHKGLHTSCKIERCKDYTQFHRFYTMKSQMIPFSAIEMSLASRSKHLSKEEAILEIKNSLGFSLQSFPECAMMKEYLK